MASEVRHTFKYSTGEQELKKDSKIVTFYKNGDIYFNGYVVTITPRRFRSFEVLLSELSRVTNLPQGVRYLLDRESGSQVDAIEQLQDGKAYVCASNSRLKRLDYGKKNGHLPQWGSRNKIELPALTNYPAPPATHTPRLVKTRRVETKERKTDIPRLRDTAAFKARNVTVIRNGHKPQISVRVLLNKRTAQTVNQFLDLVNDCLGVTGSSNVRKLYTSNGKQIYEVADLFSDENGVFVAVGNERFRVDDIEGILSGDNKNTARKSNRNHHSRVSNDGMDKHENSKENSRKTKDNNIPASINKDNSLPKIQDTVAANNNNNNYQVKRKVNEDRSPHRKQVGKHNHHAAKESRTVEKNNDESSNNVKLPHITGAGHNLVSTTNEKQEHRTRKTSKSKKDSNARISTPRGVAEDDKISESHDNTENTEKPKSRGSKDFSHEQEIEYGRVTDKKVEEVYDIGRKIGDGNFAVVRQCTSKSSKKDFALKIIDKRKISGKEKMIEDEISIMRRCRHPNIVRLYEDYDTTTEMFLVMEFVRGGDLFDAISASVKFSENVAKDYFRDMCKALSYLHRQNIVHRDLKPENLLVHKRPNGQKKLKLADFGLAVEVKLPLFTVCGTPTYVAPEILEEEGYGLKIDMWAAGVITYIMLCGFPPFRSAKRDQDELFDLIQAGDYEFLSPYWDKISNDGKDLISNLLVVDPHKRISSEKALNHKWVKLKSPTAGDLSRALLGDGAEVNSSKRRFKAAAIAVQVSKKFENLAEEFRQHRGERFIST
ncbi:hypothetical protein QZH41_020198 [Actinostola sp. cb2023]|nr:hypothetical protein QZH41_020198 [Actinostola sp. cb2023]